MQMDITGKAAPWPLIFPQERVIVKRPCLRHICQGNTYLGELLSYFLYEIGKEALYQDVDPMTVVWVTMYRTQDELLYGLDYSVSKKALMSNIAKLEQLGFLKADPQHHAYTILVEKIREAVALYSEEIRRRPPRRGIVLSKSAVHASHRPGK